MATITLERDGLQLVGTREEPFGEIYDMAIIFHGFTANRNTSLLREIANSLRDENIASVSFDFNGHGTSVYNYIRNNCPDIEIIIFKLLNKNGKANGKIFIQLLRDIMSIWKKQINQSGKKCKVAFISVCEDFGLDSLL